MCQGFFVISEIFKRDGDFQQSISALNRCQELAREHCFDIPFIFSALSLGQIETAKVSGNDMSNKIVTELFITIKVEESITHRNGILSFKSVYINKFLKKWVLRIFS